MAIRLITSPTVEPVTLADAKAQAVIGHDADDALVALLISVSREHGESLTGRSWAVRTLELVRDSFPTGMIELPSGPVISLISIKYLDAAGVEQTLVAGADYDLDADSLCARIVPANQGSWPTTKPTLNAVRIRYQAGWLPETFPLCLKQWLLIRVASLYSQREAHIAGPGMLTVMPMERGFSESLLDAYRVVEAP